MKTNRSTHGSRSRALDLQPSSEGLTTTSKPLPSSDGGSRSALTAATAAAAASANASTAKAAALCSKTLEPYSGFTEPSSDSLGAACSESHQTGPGSLDFEPAYVSCIAQEPCTTTDLGSSPGPAPTSSSGPGSGSVPGSCSGPGHGSVPGSGSVPGHGSGQGSCPASGTGPGPGPGPKVSPSTPQRFRNLRSDLLPDNTSWGPYCHWEPQKQPTWEFLQVAEPGTRGLWKPKEVEGKPKFHYRPLPRGHCLLYNWEEERATNHLDQVPSSQDGSESFFFRHGHQGLLTILQSPVLSTTTQKDSYQPPRNFHQPLPGKREAMLEMLLYQQTCLMTTVRSSLKPSGYKGQHSYRYVRVHYVLEVGRKAGQRLLCCGLREGEIRPHPGTSPGCQLHQDTGHTIPEELQLLNTSALVSGTAFAL
ncbi:Sperm-associated antigen 8 [Fukomys damarensis]|uniref:Sperm-associated antigen 8 n=1 Tax=Fukomys damarensis TaxID=885580 RepID=A0A091DY30_FUKDA|nr:Sperm-associated antigen 8 [Fukomys damarensis]